MDWSNGPRLNIAEVFERRPHVDQLGEANIVEPGIRPESFP
jgi:hypothetical protein